MSIMRRRCRCQMNNNNINMMNQVHVMKTLIGADQKTRVKMKKEEEKNGHGWHKSETSNR